MEQEIKKTFMTSYEAAKEWGLTERYVCTLCRHGKISGAVKRDNKWLIPMGMKRAKNERTKA